MTLGSLRGRLIVATPPLTDPNFDRSVVLILEHNADGALGLVLNRPSATPLTDALPEWHAHAAAPAVVYVGGPVSSQSLIGLASVADTVPDASLFTSLFLGLGTVDLAHEPRDIDGLQLVRVFAGYAGWAPSQLEGEIEAGAWISAEALLIDVFTGSADELWRSVLERQGGELAILARVFPDDPSLN